MRPEASKKEKGKSEKEEYLALGIPEEWISPIHEPLARRSQLGYDTVEKLKAVEKPGKLHQEMMGYRKKNKLDIPTLTLEQVSDWIGS